jgi:hypothetical protein
MKNNIFIILIVVIISLGGILIIRSYNERNKIEIENEEQALEEQQAKEEMQRKEREELEKAKAESEKQTLLGQSVEGRDIMAYHFGKGDKELMFIGGIHGGYAWNTVLLARELKNYLETNPEVIPEDLKITVIPVMNPDGLAEIFDSPEKFTKSDAPDREETVAGRFNANDVDLNRNFECDWKEEGVWQNKKVSGGTEEFSEPESKAIKKYVEAKKPVAIITWYTSAGGVFSSSCYNGISDEVKEITNLYADASGYKAFEEFDFYEINGDMVNWFAKKGITGISVLLSDHDEVEWSENRKGIEALIDYYSEPEDEDVGEE